MTLEERKLEFCNLAYSILGNESLTDFLEYWTEHSFNGKKMRFEKEKVFDIKRRFATWQRNSVKWNKADSGFLSHALKVEQNKDDYFKRLDSGL